MTNRAPRLEKAFTDEKRDTKDSAQIIESNLEKVLANLTAIATTLPGNEPLKTEIDLLNKALRQAKRLHTDKGLDKLLAAHEEWLKAIR